MGIDKSKRDFLECWMSQQSDNYVMTARQAVWEIQHQIIDIFRARPDLIYESENQATLRRLMVDRSYPEDMNGEQLQCLALPDAAVGPSLEGALKEEVIPSLAGVSLEEAATARCGVCMRLMPCTSDEFGCKRCQLWVCGEGCAEHHFALHTAADLLGADKDMEGPSFHSKLETRLEHSPVHVTHNIAVLKDNKSTIQEDMSPSLGDEFPNTDSSRGHRALQDPESCDSSDALLISWNFDIDDFDNDFDTEGARRYPPATWYEEDDDDYNSDGEYIEDNYGSRGYDGEPYDGDGNGSAIQGFDPGAGPGTNPSVHATPEVPSSSRGPERCVPHWAVTSAAAKKKPDNYGGRGHDGEPYDCDGDGSAIQGKGSGGCWRRPDIELKD
jgi:hypothetical protein